MLDFLRHVPALPRLSFTMPKGRIFPILGIFPLCHVFLALEGERDLAGDVVPELLPPSPRSPRFSFL